MVQPYRPWRDSPWRDSRSIAKREAEGTSGSSDPLQTGGTSKTWSLCRTGSGACSRRRRTGQPSRERPDYLVYSGTILCTFVSENYDPYNFRGIAAQSATCNDSFNGFFKCCPANRVPTGNRFMKSRSAKPTGANCRSGSLLPGTPF